MSSDHMVDAEGYISDESDFYGSKPVQAALERRVRRGLQSSDTPFFHLTSIANKTKRADSKPATVDQHQLVLFTVEHRDDVRAVKRVKLEPARLVIEERGRTAAPPSSSSSSSNVLDFLKSRLQLQKLQSEHVRGSQPVPHRTADMANANPHEDPMDLDPTPPASRLANSATWQQGDETIIEFLRRAPVEAPASAELGPWLWVHAPKVPSSQRNQLRKSDVAAFEERGSSLTHKFEAQRAKIESVNLGKAIGTITRKMGPYRDQLEVDLLAAAVETGVTGGKWMLFPSSADLLRVWRLVAEATSEGRLGPTSKVGTYYPILGKDETLVCVYTYAFTDEKDVRRVVEELVDMGLCSRDGRAIFYKCDAYTYLGIGSDNPYKMRASLYSSTEVLRKDLRVDANGAVARLKKKQSAKITDFLLA